MKYLKKFINKEDYTPSIVSEDTVSLIRQLESEDFECMIDGNEKDLGLIGAWEAKKTLEANSRPYIIREINDVSNNGLTLSVGLMQEGMGLVSSVYPKGIMFPSNLNGNDYTDYEVSSSGNEITIHSNKEDMFFQLVARPLSEVCADDINWKIRIRGLSEGQVIKWYVTEDDKKYYVLEWASEYKLIKEFDHNGDYDLPSLNEIKSDGKNYITLLMDIPVGITEDLIIESLTFLPDGFLLNYYGDIMPGSMHREVQYLEDFTLIYKVRPFTPYINFQDECVEGLSFYIDGINTDDGKVTKILSLEQWSENKNKLIINGKENEIGPAVKNCGEDVIGFVTKSNFNGSPIESGEKVGGTSYSVLNIGGKTYRIGDIPEYFPCMIFYSAYLFNRSLDEQEIKSFIRKYIDPEYLLPSEVPTPDCYYDFSQSSNDDENRETIKDYSGNGNDAIAHNFAWSGMSGYGGYGTNFIDWNNNPTQATFTKTSKTIKVTEVLQTSGFCFLSNIDNTKDYELRFKIIGLNGKSGNFGYFGNPLKFDLDGEYTYKVTANTYSSPYNVAFRLDQIGGCDITIELLPEYPGALVFDGTDDYISLDTFVKSKGFNTLFILVQWFSNYPTIIYDERASGNDYAIVTSDTNSSSEKVGLYYGRVEGASKNYITSYINNNKCRNLREINGNSYSQLNVIGKKHLIMIKSEYKGTDRIDPMLIGVSRFFKSYPNMALYKFLGFKQTLTDEQVQYVIKKYGLLDGVDEIKTD